MNVKSRDPIPAALMSQEFYDGIPMAPCFTQQGSKAVTKSMPGALANADLSRTQKRGQTCVVIGATHSQAASVQHRKHQIFTVGGTVGSPGS